ncbi:MAG: CheR family methyltransferase [Actinomycetota bacterium]
METAGQTLKPAEFSLFRDFIHTRSGIYLDDYKTDALRITLNALMRQRDIESYAEYYRVLEDKEEGEEETKRLLDLVTVSETCFFRNPAQFDALRKVVLPDLVRKKEAAGDRSLRIWSAGCSTGEEPYSIAIVLLEALPNPDKWRIDIMATDVSRQVLASAQKGEYTNRSLRETPQHYLRRYFTKGANDAYHIDQRVKNMVGFNYHNLVIESYPMLILGGWDIIFCRNVTIYFQLESTRKVITDFYKALHDGGYLFIGHAESLYKINDDFIPMHVGSAYVYKKDMTAKTKASVSSPRSSRVEKQERGGKTMPKRTTDKQQAKRVERGQYRREEDKEGLYARAYEHFVKEEFEEAARLASRLIRIQPDHTDARILLANILVNQGRTERAVKEISAVIDKEPMSSKGHYLLGLIWEKQGAADAAIREYKRVLMKDPDFALAHINLASIYTKRNMAAEAAGEYNSAIAALGRSPRGDWADFAGGFLGEVLVEACRRNIDRLAK